MNLSKQEAALVAKGQEAFKDAKAALRALSNAMREMAKINRDAGRAKASNAAMQLEGKAIALRGELIVAHAVASDALCECFDDGGIVVQGGGGGR